jgi:carbon monoxide dehydrogenase subunit G
MISLSEQITIPSPLAVVWPLLADPGLVASCVPGATLTASSVHGVYEGSVPVKLGPAVSVFRGEVRLAYDDDARTCTIEGRGIDGRGQSRAVASGVVSVSGTDTTVVKVEGSFTLTGPLEAFANAGVDVTRALLAEFAHNMEQLLTAEGAPAPEAETIPMFEPQTAAMQARALAAAPARASVAPPAATELRGGRLLWRAAIGFLRQMFSREGAAK